MSTFDPDVFVKKLKERRFALEKYLIDKWYLSPESRDVTQSEINTLLVLIDAVAAATSYDITPRPSCDCADGTKPW